MLLDGLFCQSHFVGDFLVGPALQEMLDDDYFASRQIKLLLRLGDDLVLPRANPDLVYHDEDSCFPFVWSSQAHSVNKHGALEGVHDAPELKLFPVLRLPWGLKDIPNFIGEADDGWREHPVCRFSTLGSNDLFAQFPCPLILIE